jgi:hypothetical protein
MWSKERFSSMSTTTCSIDASPFPVAIKDLFRNSLNVFNDT